VHFPGGLYHVISRGNQRQSIYKDDEDYRRFQTLLSEVVKRYSITLYAYVLMPNHFHLLLEVSRAPLSKVMQSLLYRYTRLYNQRYRKVGHLFQGRYRAILCDRDNYLMELIRYLHLNPVRAGMISDPSRYRWSSHRDYLQVKAGTGLAVERGLAMWGLRRRQSVRAYRQFIREGLTDGHRREYYEVKEQRYLGDESFLEIVHQAIDEREESPPVKIPMQDIIQEIARGAGVSGNILLNKGRGRTGSRLRAEAAFVGREVGGFTLTEAAKYLRRDLSTISLAVKRLEEQLGSDRHQRVRIESVCARLRQGRRRKYQITKA
jgi:REP element-mobilizing transposase RayT